MRVTVEPEQIRAAFEAVKDDPSFDQSRGLWERGKPPVEMIQAMALRPEILRAFAGFGDALYPGGILERRIQELVIITASQRNECQFCENAHVDMVDIEDIIDDPLGHIADPSGLAPRERLAVAYTKAVLADSNNLPDALMNRDPRTLHRPGARRADLPRRLHQPAEPVQQQPGGALSRRLSSAPGAGDVVVRSPRMLAP